MKLNQNSIPAKLYRWFYGASEMPKSLCPYFWKVAIVYLFIVPFFLFTAPHNLVSFKDSSRDGFGERIAVSLMLWIFLAFVISMLSVFGLFWAMPKRDSFYFFSVTSGVICWIAAVVFGSIELYKHLKEKKAERDYRKKNYDTNGNWIPYEDRVYQKKPNIIVEMVKGTYNKYCPKIDWE